MTDLILCVWMVLSAIWGINHERKITKLVTGVNRLVGDDLRK